MTSGHRGASYPFVPSPKEMIISAAEALLQESQRRPFKSQRNLLIIR